MAGDRQASPNRPVQLSLPRPRTDSLPRPDGWRGFARSCRILCVDAPRDTASAVLSPSRAPSRRERDPGSFSRPPTIAYLSERLRPPSKRRAGRCAVRDGRQAAARRRRTCSVSPHSAPSVALPGDVLRESSRDEPGIRRLPVVMDGLGPAPAPEPAAKRPNSLQPRHNRIMSGLLLETRSAVTPRRAATRS